MEWQFLKSKGKLLEDDKVPQIQGVVFDMRWAPKKVHATESASKLASVLGKTIVLVWRSLTEDLYEALGQQGHKNIVFALKLCTTNPRLVFN